MKMAQWQNSGRRQMNGDRAGGVEPILGVARSVLEAERHQAAAKLESAGAPASAAVDARPRGRNFLADLGYRPNQ